ncbi:MAG: ATP-binding cassette domain-containing protein [Chloroflexi bacterium]|nr:ATP-binding cassette domain-containing protein [Chloroflexota bacterium]
MIETDPAPPQEITPSQPVLSVRNVSAGYPSARNALQHVSFDVLPGERIAVLGPNGAGKSTLFKAIVGLIPFTGGDISIHGKDCHASHGLVGYVPQHNSVDWNFPATVADVVMMGRLRQIGWFRLPNRKHWELVDHLLEQVGLVGLRDRRIGQLSGGQRQRVFIARALAQETDVLLLDEPFSGVDAAAEHEILDVLDRLQAEHVTVITATHDLSMAASRFERVLLIRQGVIAYGTAAEVFQPENFAAAYGSHVGVFQNGQFFVVDEH